MDYNFGDERLPGRFWQKVRKQPDGCWVWTASTSKTTGYGWYRLEGKTVSAHRLICRSFHGEPPSGMNYALHFCDNRACVNPGHLRWGSAQDNTNDMFSRGRNQTYTRKDTCGKGHPMTGENVYHSPRGARSCRECGRQWWREWNRRRREPGYAPNLRGRLKQRRKSEEGAVL